MTAGTNQWGASNRPGNETPAAGATVRRLIPREGRTVSDLSRAAHRRAQLGLVSSEGAMDVVPWYNEVMRVVISAQEGCTEPTRPIRWRDEGY